MASSLLLSLLIFFLLPLSSPLPAETIFDAAEILSDSGFVSMALTLEFVSESLAPQSSSLTIFSPSDSAFVQSGQPSLSLLQFHFLPLHLPPENLKSLSFGSKIPTMLSSQSLTVTSRPFQTQMSLNNVKVNESPLYDDGFLIVFGIEKFLDPNFQVSMPTQSSGPNLGCGSFGKNETMEFYSFSEASEALRSNGYSRVASFLDLQIPGTRAQTPLTVFAPADEAVTANSFGNFIEHPSNYFRQIVPCRLLWDDLVNLENGTVLPSFLEDYTINVTRSGSVLILNQVPVFYPDMYLNDWLVIHGLREAFSQQDGSQEKEGSSLKKKSNTQELVLNQG